MLTSYAYNDAAPTWANSYLWPELKKLVGTPRRAFDLGCGNGATANMLSAAGFSVVGVDPSEEGIMHGRRAFPHLSLQVGSCYDPLAERFGTFPLVISLEVIEHCFYPRQFAKCVYDLLEPGGLAIISTPYHGYLKNLALAASGKLDAHFTALWDGGHIKFWSVATLRKLLEETGFSHIRFSYAGRFPPLAKSMIALGSR